MGRTCGRLRKSASLVGLPGPPRGLGLDYARDRLDRGPRPGEEGRRARRGGPFYIKTHSWGEFVFDFEFAEIAQRAKADWYPKLIGMVPATPAPAWKVLVAPEPSGGPEEEFRFARPSSMPRPRRLATRASRASCPVARPAHGRLLRGQRRP